jgi:DNA-binding response OmpR family regulator
MVITDADPNADLTPQSGVTPHVLVVDDDPGMRAFIAEYLSEYRFRVTGVPDGNSMRKVFKDTVVDVIVLDLKLPSEDGMAIASELRAQSNIPIVMITGRQAAADRIIGLELGADDYLTKPFDPRELLARIRTILRRAHAFRETAVSTPTPRAYRFAGWELDLHTRRLFSSAGERVDLTHAEFELLIALLAAPHRVLTRNQLLEMSRRYDDEVFDRSIDALILRLRRKIEADPARPALIRTERGVGYFLDANVDTVG